MTTENPSPPQAQTGEAAAEPKLRLPEAHPGALTNPYGEFPQESANRIQTNVSPTDYLLIKLIRPGHGTIRSVIGTLWFKLCQSLRENDILDNSKQNEFERFISTARIIDNDTYLSLYNDATQWRQHVASRGGGAGEPPTISPTGPDSANRGAVSQTARRNVRKRAA